MAKELVLDADVVYAIKQGLVQAGAEQHDIDRLGGPESAELWEHILKYLTGQVDLMGEPDMHPLDAPNISRRKAWFYRQGKTFRLNEFEIELVACASVAHNVDALLRKYDSAGMLPPPSVLEELVKHPHMLPSAWRQPKRLPYMNVWFLSTHAPSEREIRTLYCDPSQERIEIGYVSAEPNESFNEDDYVAVLKLADV